jgi:hypothetical protein
VSGQVFACQKAGHDKLRVARKVRNMLIQDCVVTGMSTDFVEEKILKYPLIIVGFLLILIVILVTLYLSAIGKFDVMANLQEIWFWVANALITLGVALIVKGFSSRRKVPEPKPALETPVPPQPSDMVLDEQTTTVLIRLAKMEYRHTLRDQLNYIWKDVDKEWWHGRFLIWKNLSPVLKSLLITYKPEYDALEDFANALDQFSDNENKADSDALKTLCRNRFDRLKELGLVY